MTTLDNLGSVVVDCVKVVGCKEVSIFIGSQKFGEREAHFLQRWSSKWEKFIDIVLSSDVKSGNCIRVVVKRGCSSKDSASVSFMDS